LAALGWATMPLSEQQVKLRNQLLDGFERKFTSSKWAARENSTAWPQAPIVVPVSMEMG
jgi:hypothetical protein